MNSKSLVAVILLLCCAVLSSSTDQQKAFPISQLLCNVRVSIFFLPFSFFDVTGLERNFQAQLWGTGGGQAGLGQEWAGSLS